MTFAMKWWVLVAFGWSALPLHAAPTAWLRQQTEGMQRIIGPFAQYDYGFKIEPPPGTAAYVASGISGDHGLLIILGEHRTIAVYPEYDLREPSKVVPCEAIQFPWETNSARTNGTIRLGNRPACLAIFARQGLQRSLTQATGNDRGQAILYTLLLTTNRRHARTDMVAFQRVAASFRRIPIVP